MKKLSEAKMLGIVCTALGTLALLCVAALVFLAVNGAKPLPQKENEAEEQPGNSAMSPAILGDTPDYGQAYADSIVFLGDSTTAQMRYSNILSGGEETKQIWTGESGTLSLDYSIDSALIVYPETGEEMTIGEAVALKKPDYVIITLGISNGVSYCNEEKFKAYYGKLLDSVTESSPSTKIMLQSILPVSKKVQKDTPSLSNDKIDRANGWIISLAEQYGLRYLDTASTLKSSDGMLDKQYDSGDGIHPNAEGYAKVIEYIRTHGYQ